jgi:hypothetical protein
LPPLDRGVGLIGLIGLWSLFPTITAIVPCYLDLEKLLMMVITAMILICFMIHDVEAISMEGITLYDALCRLNIMTYSVPLGFFSSSAMPPYLIVAKLFSWIVFHLEIIKI